MSFIGRINAAQQANNSLLCVGWDPELEKFPAHLRDSPDALFDFFKAVVDATADLVCAFKPQIAYFAAHGAEDQLAQYTATFLQEKENANRIFEEVKAQKVFDYLKTVITLDQKEIAYNKFQELN